LNIGSWHWGLFSLDYSSSSKMSVSFVFYQSETRKWIYKEGVSHWSGLNNMNNLMLFVGSFACPDANCCSFEGSIKQLFLYFGVSAKDIY
jgi:hypothetical protein